MSRLSRLAARAAAIASLAGPAAPGPAAPPPRAPPPAAVAARGGIPGVASPYGAWSQPPYPAEYQAMLASVSLPPQSAVAWVDGSCSVPGPAPAAPPSAFNEPFAGGFVHASATATGTPTALSAVGGGQPDGWSRV